MTGLDGGPRAREERTTVARVDYRYQGPGLLRVTRSTSLEPSPGEPEVRTEAAHGRDVTTVE